MKVLETPESGKENQKHHNNYNNNIEIIVIRTIIWKVLDTPETGEEKQVLDRWRVTIILTCQSSDVQCLKAVYVRFKVFTAEIKR